MQKHKSPLTQILKEYRDKYDIKQEQLASELSIDVRTLRRYENGESILSDIHELRRIANILGIDTERLGILPVLSTPEEVDLAIERAWKLIKLARYYEANVLVERMVHDIAGLVKTEDSIFLRRLAYAHHLAGYVKSQVTRANETQVPFAHYQEMEQIARTLNDQTLLNIALTYEGDMLQRGGNVRQGILYLEAARDTTPLADISSRGNAIQLLGRAYFKAKRLADFERAMEEARELAHQLDRPETTSAKGQYNVGTVLEEYGRSYGLIGQTDRAMGYLNEAEQYFTAFNYQNRNILLKTATAMTLVYGGEIREGVKVAIESIELCRRHGNIRLLDRIYGVQKYIDRLSREMGTISGELREALDGPIEF